MEFLGVSAIGLIGVSICCVGGVLLLGFLGDELNCDVLGLWYRDRGGLDTTGGCKTALCLEPSVIEVAAEPVPGLEVGGLLARWRNGGCSCSDRRVE